MSHAPQSTARRVVRKSTSAPQGHQSHAAPVDYPSPERRPATSHFDGEEEFIQSLVSKYMENEVSQRPRTAPPPTEPSKPRPKRQMTEEQLANLARGREKAIQSRREKQAAARKLEMDSLVEQAAAKAVQQYKDSVAVPSKTEKKPAKQKRVKVQAPPEQGSDEDSEPPVQERAPRKPRRVQEPSSKRRTREAPPSPPRERQYRDDPRLVPTHTGVYQHTNEFMSVPPPTIDPRLLRPAF